MIYFRPKEVVNKFSYLVLMQTYIEGISELLAATRRYKIIGSTRFPRAERTVPIMAEESITRFDNAGVK